MIQNNTLQSSIPYLTKNFFTSPPFNSCEKLENQECISTANSIPFVTIITTKSLVRRQSHLSECDARLNADRTPTIKLRKGGTRDTSLRSERRNSLDLCCRMSHPSRGRTVMYQKGECGLQGDVARPCRGITQPCTSIEKTLWTTEGAQVAPRRAQSEIAPEMERT